MRTILLFFLFFISIAGNSQNVTITDPAFKNLLLSTNSTVQNYPLKAYNTNQQIVVDANNDDEIQLSEALAVHRITIGGSSLNITTLQGIEAFSNLESLEIEGGLDISVLDITMLPSMKILTLVDLPLLQSVNVSGLQLMNWVVIGTCPALTTFSMQNLPELTELYLTNTNVASLDVSGSPNLFYLDCRNNNIQILTLSNHIYLDELWCNGNNISTLNCSGLPSIRNFIAIGNNLNAINTTGLSKLEWFDISDNNVTEVDLSTNIKMKYFIANNNYLSTIDVSNTIATVLSAKNNLITYANIKNGKIFSTLELENNPLTMACISDNLGSGHYQAMQTKFSQMGYPNVALSSFCSFEPAGGYNKITGNFKFDNNGNGCGPEDAAFANARVKIINGQSTAYYFSGTNGEYTAFTGEGASTLSYSDETNILTAAPASYDLNFAGTGGAESRFFCVTAPASVQDLEIKVVPITPAQPGFDSRYKIVYKNKGSIGSLSGTVTLSYDDARLDLVNTMPAALYDAAGMITWNFTGLQPFENRSIDIVFNLNASGEIPPIVLNDVLAFTAAIATTVEDVSPLDNQLTLNQTVTGSFDPNDIICLEGEIVNPSAIGGYLHYNINFENVGTAPATFIVVEDEFDTSKYDVDSFRLVSASHDVKAKIVGNKATFRFDAINLGPEEKGNIIFRIKTLPSLVTGASVSNKANIFFDYNLPIVTNDANTTFQALSTGNWAKDDSVKVYPNPSAGMVKIEASSAINSIELYDTQGRLLEVQKSGEMNSALDMATRANGIYFIKVMTDKGVKVEKIIRE